MATKVVVQAVDGDSQRRWAPVNAGPRVWNPSHVIQKSSHFREGERVVGLHGPPAGVHERNVVLLSLEGFERPAVQSQILEQVQEKRSDFLTVEQLWRRSQTPRSVGVVEMETEFVQSTVMGVNQSGLASIEVEFKRLESRLWFPRLPSMAKTLVPDALVKGVLVNEQQFILGLHQNVRVGELCQRFHVRQVVEFAFQGSFFARTNRRSTSGMTVQVAFSR